VIAVIARDRRDRKTKEESAAKQAPPELKSKVEVEVKSEAEI